MANLLCMMLGHKHAVVPFSSGRVFCPRCGLDLSAEAAPSTVPALPPIVPKHGAARRLHR